MAERHFTTADAARLLGIHSFTVGRHVDAGVLKGFRTGGGHRRILASELRRFIDARGMEVPPELEHVGGGKRLLVVDDDAAVLRAVVRAFKAHARDIEVKTTTSGVEALLLLGQNRPDAVLFDLMMPGLDGLELCKRVRAIPSFNEVLLLAMTSSAGTDVIGSTLRAGANQFFEKPVDPAAVLALLGPTSLQRK